MVRKVGKYELGKTIGEGAYSKCVPRPALPLRFHRSRASIAVRARGTCVLLARRLLACTLYAHVPRGRVRGVALCAESAVTHCIPPQSQVCHRHRVRCPRGDQNYGPGRVEGAEDARRRPPRGAMPGKLTSASADPRCACRISSAFCSFLARSPWSSALRFR